MSDSTEATTGPGSSSGSDDARRPERVRERRGNPISRAVRAVLVFYRQVVAELRKVIWPTRRELVTYTAVVLVFVFFMVAVVALYDFASSQAVLKVFGEG